MLVKLFLTFPEMPGRDCLQFHYNPGQLSRYTNQSAIDNSTGKDNRYHKSLTYYIPLDGIPYSLLVIH